MVDVECKMTGAAAVVGRHDSPSLPAVSHNCNCTCRHSRERAGPSGSEKVQRKADRAGERFWRQPLQLTLLISL